MKAAAKYLFDEDFASGEKPTITMVESQRRRVDADRKPIERALWLARPKRSRTPPSGRSRSCRYWRRAGPARQRVNGNRNAPRNRSCRTGGRVAASAPALITREPMVEIAALATECFHHLVATPHVAVRVGPAIFEIAKTKIDEIAQGRGFEGRLAMIFNKNSQLATAGSNGPMAASPATRPQQAQPSMKWSTATYGRALRPALRISGDRSNE